MAMIEGLFGSCSTGSVATVGCGEFEKLMSRSDAGFVLLDVRTAEEFAQGHLTGAVNVDVQKDGFDEAAVALLRRCGAKEALVYCRSGRRSLDAAARLSKAGFKAVNLDEGIIGWQKRGGTVVGD